MYKKFGPLLVLFFILFSSCQNISRSRIELGIPERTVIFSFDDGPEGSNDATARLLDVLKKHRIHAQFCLLGVNAEQYPDLVRRIYDEGHTIINHGYFDKHNIKMKNEKFRNNIIRGEEAISTALGFNWHPRLYRPHGGLYRSRHETIWIDEGYAMAPVNVRVYDAVKAAPSRQKIIRRSIRKLEKQGGGIILLHDSRGSFSRSEKICQKHPGSAFNRSWIPETVEELITILQDNGFILTGKN